MLRFVVGRRRLVSVGLLVFVVGFSLAFSLVKTHSVVYGQINGKIAYTREDGSNEHIFTINADGSGIQQLTTDDFSSLEPRWSPDGSKIVYIADPDNDGNLQIFTMNADGSNQVQLTHTGTQLFDPAWSPDGTKIAFVDDSQRINVMDADGTNAQVLTSNPAGDRSPTWKPDGSVIAYQCNDGTNDQLCTVEPDGTNQTALTNDTHDHQTPAWSPDGSTLVFIYAAIRYDQELATVDASGNNLHIIATSDNNNEVPSWSPDGTKIVYDNVTSGDTSNRIYYINADGTNETAVTPNDGNFTVLPSWQPADNDGDGTLNAVELAGPNGGDANGDGVADETQSQVTSFVNPVSGTYTVLQSSCTANSSVSAASEAADHPDTAFSYPEGLLSFVLTCSTPGTTATITEYFFGLANNSLVLRKYVAATHQYQTISGASVTSATIGGQAATKATYTVTDGGALDEDGAANGTIVDPVGIATPTVGVPNTGLGGTAAVRD